MSITQNRQKQPPQIIKSIAGLRAVVDGWKAKGETVMLVPTMGALHAGHLSLVRIARREADRVIVSIFVNPAQFAPDEDFAEYPRELESDIEKLGGENADLVYAPPQEIMYGEGASTRIRVEGLSDQLCGLSRPHFFGGVATIVAKLFIQCRPDMAIFGEKDYQQLLVIRQLVRDLDLPVKIYGGVIIREQSGLAMSSRNSYLSAEQKKAAPALYRIMSAAAQRIIRKENIAEVVRESKAELLKAGFDKIDYLEVHDAQTLEPVSRLGEAPARLFAAVWLGETRLIDNIAL